jgi:hypothetical protein
MPGQMAEAAGARGRGPGRALQVPMLIRSLGRPFSEWALVRLIAIFIAVGSLMVCVVRSFGGKLWLDELYTIYLLRAPSLPHLWQAVVWGIDGNPPLYLTASWLAVHASPQVFSWIEILRWSNAILAVAALAILFRVSRRFVSAGTGLMAVLLFAALNRDVLFLVLELRAYAAYLFFAAVSILLQQRLLEKGRTSDFVLLSLAYSCLAMIHTFGISYVVCIGMAAWVSTVTSDRAAAKRTLLAMLPAMLVFAGWLPFLLQQAEVARPYGWIRRPDLVLLVQTLLPSSAYMEAAFGYLAAIAAYAMYARKTGLRGLNWRWLASDASTRDIRFAALLMIAFWGFTIAAWVVSIAVFPIFVHRYFTPNLIVSFAINVALCRVLFGVVTAYVPPSLSKAVTHVLVLIPAVLLSVTLLSVSPARNQLNCADREGRFFEDAHVRDDLPIVAESPHAWFPRIYYSRNPALYRFPLDWEVVLRFPDRASNNATDFHIMERYRRWAAVPEILTTEEIIRAHPEFLVINESNRSWFRNLGDARRVTAEKLAEITDAPGHTCTLWRVKSIQERN